MDVMEKFVKPGVKIELQPVIRKKLNGKEEPARYYQSKISDVREDGLVEAYMPTEQSRLVLLDVDGLYYMYCYTPAGLYQCQVKVNGRYKSGSIYYALLEIVSGFRKNQRRQYYRYPCIITMENRMLSSAEKRWLEDRNEFVLMEERLPLDTSAIADISGGGIRFVAMQKYEKGDLVYCRFQFGEEHQVCVEILEASEIEERPGEYRHRAQFQALDEKERDKMIKHIFKQDRLRRKGLKEGEEGEEI